MPTQHQLSNSSRFNELQQRLQRRKNFLKPSDFCSNSKVKNLLAHHASNTVKANRHHSVLSENNPKNPSSSSQAQGVKRIQAIHQESQEGSQENAPQLANSKQEKVKPTPETNKMRGSSYLPVAASKKAHLVQDAEAEYRNLFNAPSSIELYEKATFDDGVTEVSEITTDIRTLSTKGASYVERRMASKMKNILATSHKLAHQPSGLRYEDQDATLEKSSSYVELGVEDLKHLSKAVEKAKLDLQRGGPKSRSGIVTRHGLPYESTDFRAEGDEDDSWAGVIRDTQPRGCPSRQSRDPEDGEIICLQGPPTPRSRPSPEKIHGLLRETLSSDGDVIIDTTEICDEDLDGVAILNDSSQPIKIDDRTVGTSVLLGEVIMDHDEGMGTFDLDFKRPPRQDFVEALASTAKDPSESVSGNNTSTASIPSSSVHNDYEAHYIQSNRDDSSSILVQADFHRNNGENFASDIYNTSVAFFKTFADHIENQLKIIQSQGLITEQDMDGMLGVLEKDIKETSIKLPKEGDHMVVFLGEELEKTATCGAKQAVTTDVSVAEKSTVIAAHQADSVEKMLDSFRASYKSSVSHCGVDQNMIQENTKAMEDMVSNLKKAYNKNVSACGGGSNDVLAAAAAKMNTMNKQGTSITTGRTMTLMDDAAVGSPSFTNLVKQLQEEQNNHLAGVRAQNNGSQLKEYSSEAVEEMLQKARDACNQKSSKLAKLKKRRGNKPAPQKFVVPISMPKKNNDSYSEIE